MIIGERVRQARELRGLTQRKLADQMGVSQANIAHIEAGRQQPSDEFAEQLALQTGFPPAFFHHPSPDFPLGSLLFRARTSMTAAERDAVHGYGQIMFEVAEHMISHLRVVDVRVPRVDEDPATAAQITRTSMGLGPQTPIANVLRVVERAGVLVLMLPIEMDRGDGYSAWAGTSKKRPVIVLTGGTPGDRLRFTAAHELGHLVMHAAPHSSISELDAEAHLFAAEFLMPEAAMRQAIVPPITLAGLADLKPQWGVSIQALIMRCRQLDFITDRQKSYLFEQMGAMNWRRREPKNLDVATERPRAVQKMAELLYGKPINFEQLAADVHLSPTLVRQIIEVHNAVGDPATLESEGEQSEPKVVKFGRTR